jgi:hypothetical protein
MYRYVLVRTGTYRYIRFCPILYRCIGFRVQMSTYRYVVRQSNSRTDLNRVVPPETYWYVPVCTILPDPVKGSRYRTRIPDASDSSLHDSWLRACQLAALRFHCKLQAPERLPVLIQTVTVSFSSALLARQHFLNLRNPNHRFPQPSQCQ